MKRRKPKRKSNQTLMGGNQLDINKVNKNHRKKVMRWKKSKNADLTLHDCKFCSKFFASAERLKEHASQVHNDVTCEQIEERSYQCKICFQYLSSEESLSKHLKLCKTQTVSSALTTETVDDEFSQLKCKLCNVYFASEETLASHKEEMHVCHSIATCPCCSTQVRTPNPNLRSIETQTIELQDCDRCDEKFESKNELAWHRLKSHKITPGVVYLENSRPQGRPPLPNLKEKLTCSICGKVFEIGYIRRNADEKKIKYQCKDCYNTFGEELHLDNHQSVACSECDRLFTSLQSLQAHLRWHNIKKVESKVGREKTWICHVCGQVYGRKSHLTTHLKRHEGIRSYPCPHCDKAFYTSYNLKIHVWTHTGERPYMCTKAGCFKRFTQKSHLKYHMSTHHKKKTPQESPVDLEISAASSRNTVESQRQEAVDHQVLEPNQLPSTEGDIITAESYYEQEVSTTPHVGLQTNVETEQEFHLEELAGKDAGSMKTQNSSGTEVEVEITSVEPTTIFVTEIHSYSEQNIKKEPLT